MTAENGNQYWVSKLNAVSKIGPHAARKGPVRFYDTTLRDGEQTVGVALDPQQKLEIARLLDSLGISRIEAGFPRVSADDAEAFARVQKGLQSQLTEWVDISRGLGTEDHDNDFNAPRAKATMAPCLPAPLGLAPGAPAPPGA